MRAKRDFLKRLDIYGTGVIIQEFMSLESRISDAIQDWCGQAPADFTMTLEDLWILTNSPPFDPDGIELLIQALEREFQNPPSLQVTLSPPDFRAGGKVKTVQNLIDEAVTFSESESDVLALSARPAKKVARKKKAASSKPATKTQVKKSAANLPARKVVAKRPKKKLPAKKKVAARKPAAKKPAARKNAKKPTARKAARRRRR